MPSDLGFSDERFVLPQLIEKEHVVETTKVRPGMLFAMPGSNLQEERQERRNSIEERCKKAAEIVAGCSGPSVCWCELNDEADILEKMIPGAVQIDGSMNDEQKEECLAGFSSGQIRVLVTKPKIGAWGLNWQHCSNSVHFPSHSYEQYYQAVRRFYRFGQKNPVNVALIVNEGERGILESLKRKTAQTNTMFASIVKHMQDAMHLSTSDYFPEQESVPSWLA
jgi:superfamily II DNA/RNA helicase